MQADALQHSAAATTPVAVMSETVATVDYVLVAAGTAPERTVAQGSAIVLVHLTHASESESLAGRLAAVHATVAAATVAAAVVGEAEANDVVA